MTIETKMSANDLHETAEIKIAEPKTSDTVDAAIENLPDDMKDEVREQFAPYKTEFNAAIAGIYLDDFSGGYTENPDIISAADLLQKIIPLALTDHSEHAYRKNPDGTFTEDKAAFKRLEQLEKRIFAGHKIGIDNPDYLIDKLTAEYVEAEKISNQRQTELNASKKVVADAKNQADKKYFALTDLANERADKLREKFLRTANVVSDMMIRNQDGFETIPYLFTARVEFDTTKEGNNTISIVCDESEGGQFTLGTYKTFKQTENAIDLFAEAVKRGDKKFTFPPADNGR